MTEKAGKKPQCLRIGFTYKFEVLWFILGIPRFFRVYRKNPERLEKTLGIPWEKEEKTKKTHTQYLMPLLDSICIEKLQVNTPFLES
jgi:hypothetical protein